MSNDRTAVITGGSSGIGRAISFELTQSCSTIIVLSDIEVENGRIVSEEIKNNFGRKSDYYQCDVSNEGSVQEVFERIIAQYRKIDVLINNAGIIRDNLVENISASDWQHVLDVNLTGTFNCTKSVIPGMKERRYGKILNIASVSAQIGNYGQANYAASKGGVIAFTKTVARETAKYGINVNAIAPGFIKTRMTESMPQKALDRALAQIPLGRMGEVREVAILAKYLTSDDSSYITGQVVNISGGLYV